MSRAELLEFAALDALGMLDEYETGVRFEYKWLFGDQLITSNSANE